MNLLLLKKDNIYELKLPKKIYGSYYLEDKDNNNQARNLINVEVDGDKWKISSNNDAKIIAPNNTFLTSVNLVENTFYTLYIEKEKSNYPLYCVPTYDKTYTKLKIKKDGEFLIGNDNTNHIIYGINLISKNQAKLTYNNYGWTIQNLNPNVGIYVNNKSVSIKKLLSGDVIFIMGLKIIVIGKLLLINNPNNLTKLNLNYFDIINIPELDLSNEEEIEDTDEISLFEKNEYFFRAPRFRTTVEEKTVEIDSPPTKEKEEEMPLIYSIGPMLTMGLTSMVTGLTTLLNILNGKQTWVSGLPSLVIAVAMLMSMILWPFLSKMWTKSQKKKREKKRREKYSKYIEEKRQFILTTIATQRQGLIENRISLDECKNIIEHRKRNLWERKIEHDDYLSLRLGIGQVDAMVNVKYPEEHFTLDEDDLRDILNKLGSDTEIMENVPINVSFTQKYISAVIGNMEITNKFILGLILQMITFHSYEDLKIVIFTNKEKAEKWNSLKNLPHCFSDDKSVRFFSTTPDEYSQISNYLQEIYLKRTYNDDSRYNELDYKHFLPYFIVLTDDFSSIKNLEIIKSILGQKINKGFSLIINNERLLGLPNECNLFINVDKNTSGLFENELIANKQKEFKADIDYNLDIDKYCRIVANIPIEFEKDKYSLPNSIGFLEMYNVGKVEQLNSIDRWKVNNPIATLQAPVGVAENGELFKLDLHEKFHGPHGLVAGMTGSGKSEFLISYILSMAVNYSPYEVSFVLIDYKGGGLAGAFYNKETGICLPHIAGTITNLDVNDMKRSLASIESELKLRQKKFNEARELLNESTIDIYKYQKLYRNGQVKEPISHLFIISDEFAELKAQQPEFMEKLISTARIGRSLGVHLILATQKPSGVVNDQIWSNSKFRVCLKVQDKSDSNDMIKRPDAASLKNVGRFYLQVGYNEFFALGQSAWAGAPYYKLDKVRKKVDNNIDFIDNVGEVIKSIDVVKTGDTIKPIGEELPNIVNYLCDLAKEEKIKINKLWLDKIPDLIYVDDLAKKYHYKPQRFIINPIIGEYDVPNKQEQHLLTLPLSKDGNTIIYGATGSGKELVLTDIIYSTITSHSVEEANFYILDFGAETLKMFESAPHVGEVLTSIDEEKIENLFKMLKTIIEQRKKLFLEYNGNYQNYCKNSGNSVPTIIVIINNYEAFNELFNEHEAFLTQLTREGLKYGVLFILTTANLSSIRYRLKSNFNQEVVLQLNDETDYNQILGNVHKMYPAKIYGRGLVKMDDIYEFQTAHVSKDDEITKYIKDICANLRKNNLKKAKNVPILPKIVNVDYVHNKIGDITSIPVGVEKESLRILLHDFKDDHVNLVTSSNADLFKFFVPTLANVLSKGKNLQTIVLDAEKLIEQPNLNGYSYCNDNFDTVIDSIDQFLNKIIEHYKKNNNDDNCLKDFKDIVVVIIGFETFKTKLSEDKQKYLQEFLEKGSNLSKLSFILVDTVEKLKKLEFENWFKNTSKTNNAIWLGNGLADQFLLKMPVIPRYVREANPVEFGYRLKNGRPILMKYLTEKEISEDDI